MASLHSARPNEPRSCLIEPAGGAPLSPKIGPDFQNDSSSIQLLKERPVHWKPAIEVDVSAIHDIDGTRLGQQLIEDIDVVQLAVADEDEGRDIAPQIQERVQFDRRFGRAG